MELEFDKEIDALLRKGRPYSTAVTRDSAAAHLDAEGISAFAENALPEKTKQFYTSHLAECGRCRKILVQTITLNLETEPVTASSDLVRPAREESLPWYRRLVRLPSLAYAMGAFVLLFSGFLGYIAFRSMTGSTALTEVSQVADSESAPVNGPNLGEEQYSTMANRAVANAASNASGSAPNTAANAVNAAGNAANSSGRGGPSGPDLSPAQAEPKPNDILLDGVAAANEQPAAAAPPPAKDQDAERDGQRLAKEEAKADAMDASKRSDDMKVMRQKSASGPAAKKPVYGPRGDSRAQQTSPMLANRAEASTRVVSGRAFEKKDGVWYDTGYRGQATINISRSTESYRKLDRGLRTIAESLDGIVVAVWKEKAYRIQ